MFRIVKTGGPAFGDCEGFPKGKGPGLSFLMKLSIKGSKVEGSVTDLLRLVPGQMRCIRIVTAPLTYSAHMVTKKDLTNNSEEVIEHSRIVKCSGFHGSCPCCDASNYPKGRWIVGVIDRADEGKCKIWDFDAGIFQQFQTLARNSSFGDPKGYDADVYLSKDKVKHYTDAGWMSDVTIAARAKSELSNEDLAIATNIDVDVLKELCEPPTIDVTKKAYEAALKGMDCQDVNHCGQIPWFNFDTESGVVEYGADCSGCGQYFEYAVKVSGFECWGCKNGH